MKHAEAIATIRDALNETTADHVVYAENQTLIDNAYNALDSLAAAYPQAQEPRPLEQENAKLKSVLAKIRDCKNSQYHSDWRQWAEDALHEHGE